ncbi:MAG: Lrp/AsnC ligand binding domain-containing protein [Spirochaetia bacterium]
MARLENVLSVSIASGRYDLIAEVLLDSNRGLVRFLTEELSTIEGILASESFIMLKNYNKYV